MQIEELCSLDAIAGNEQEVKNYILNCKNTEEYDVMRDGLGSLVFNKPSKGPKVLFMAHMDEVGFIVKNIKKTGRLILHKVGGVDLSLSNLHKACVTTENNRKIPGVLHTIDKDKNSIAELDVGVDTMEACEDLGIQIGDMVCFASEPFRTINNRIFAKALDDRIGCYTLLKIMEKIKNEKFDCDIYFAFTSSEEVGTRGGKTVTELVNPDISFAIDVANTKAVVPKELNSRRLGEGFMIINYDKTLAPNIKFIRWMRKISDNNRLLYQNDIMTGGGTDAGSSHIVGSGRIAGALGIPLRECHGPYSLCDMRDVQSMAVMIEEIIKNINKKTIESFLI